MLRRKHLMDVGRRQDNDASCFGSTSRNRKRAKRLCSKRIRRFLKKEQS